MGHSFSESTGVEHCHCGYLSGISKVLIPHQQSNLFLLPAFFELQEPNNVKKAVAVRRMPSALPEIRTQTVMVLSHVPLPLG